MLVGEGAPLILYIVIASFSLGLHRFQLHGHDGVLPIYPLFSVSNSTRVPSVSPRQILPGANQNGNAA